MIKISTLIIIVGVLIQSLVGQTGQPINSTINPSFQTSTIDSRYAKITAIHIYEHYTLVSIKFISWIDDQDIFISSESTIEDYYNSNDVFPIIKFANNEFDIRYKLNPKGQANYFDLIFDRVPPGIEIIDIVCPLPIANQKYYWGGVSIKNPNNHPKTSWREQSLKDDWEKNG
ncbi:MAG TPA: hypothetical protein VGA29_02240, partial [Ignavibacteriaceae bacterium]